MCSPVELWAEYDGATMTVHPDVYFTCGHCKATHDLDSLRNGLYVGQRTIGDLQAFEHAGALSLGKRLARRKATRSLMQALFR